MPDMERTIRNLELHMAEAPEAKLAVQVSHSEIDRRRWKFVAIVAWGAFAFAIVGPLLLPA